MINPNETKNLTAAELRSSLNLPPKGSVLEVVERTHMSKTDDHGETLHFVVVTYHPQHCPEETWTKRAIIGSDEADLIWDSIPNEPGRKYRVESRHTDRKRKDGSGKYYVEWVKITPVGNEPDPTGNTDNAADGDSAA